MFFVIGLVPLAASFVIYHPDERHYWDGGMSMLKSGDYLTPRSAEGRPRFLKPIVSYWLVAASYAVFGINPLAGRFPFIVLSAAGLALTYRLARTLTQDHAIAQLAAVLLLSNPLYFLSAARSMPDMPLCFFLLVSAHGFLLLLHHPQPSRCAYYAAYIGAGLAVATKGLLPLLFVGFCWIFARLHRGNGIELRRLFHMPSMAAGLLIAGSWFAIVLTVNGPAAVNMFWNDQVGQKVIRNHLAPAWQLPGLLVSLLLSFLPWSLVVVGLASARITPSGPTALRAPYLTRFALAWLGVIATVFAFSDYVTARYLLPALPLLAIAQAQVIRGASFALLEPFITRLYRTGTALALILITVIAGLLLCFATWREAAAVIVSGLAGLGIVEMAVRRQWVATTTALGAVIFAVVPWLVVSSKPLLPSDQGSQIAAVLRSMGVAAEPVILLGKPALASKIRASSGGTIHVRALSWPCSMEELDASILICTAEQLEWMRGTNLRVYPASSGFRDLPPLDVAHALVRGELAELLRKRRENYFVLVRPSPAPAISSLGG
jgi:4-amino-4-deoxy-L-arabinose transferase-like glycosyltransferase